MWAVVSQPWIPLLSMRLLTLLLVVVLGLPTLTVVLWNRVRGPRGLVVLARLALVGCCQLSAVLLAGAAANDYGYFYSSWSELVGAGQRGGPATVQHTGAGQVSPTLMPPRLAAGAGGPGAGRLVDFTVQGGRSGLSEAAQVYLPPAYDGGLRRLPVVEVFTGYPGTELNLVRRLKYPARLLDELRHGTATSMVLVLLRPTVTPPRDTECTDVPGGPAAFSFFAEEVPAAVSGAFHLQPTAYAAMGDSTGGYCAVKLALLRPDRFRAAVALSGYFHAVRDVSTGDLWGGSGSVRDHNDLVWRLKHLPPPAVSVFLGTSRTERGPDGYDAAQSFLHLFRAPASGDAFVLPSGGHSFTTWALEIPPALRWLSGKLLTAAPPS